MNECNMSQQCTSDGTGRTTLPEVQNKKDENRNAVDESHPVTNPTSLNEAMIPNSINNSGMVADDGSMKAFSGETHAVDVEASVTNSNNESIIDMMSDTLDIGQGSRGLPSSGEVSSSEGSSDEALVDGKSMSLGLTETNNEGMIIVNSSNGEARDLCGTSGNLERESEANIEPYHNTSNISYSSNGTVVNLDIYANPQASMMPNLGGIADGNFNPNPNPNSNLATVDKTFDPNDCFICIQPDYSNPISVQFLNDYKTDIPINLKPLVSEETYTNTINTINKYVHLAQLTTKHTVMESCISYLTLYVSDMFIDTQYDKYMKQLDQFLLLDNRENYSPLGIQVFHPLENGFRVVRIHKMRDGMG